MMVVLQRAAVREVTDPSMMNTMIIMPRAPLSPTECIPVVIYRWLTSPHITSRIDLSDRFGSIIKQFFRPANWPSACGQIQMRDKPTNHAHIADRSRHVLLDISLELSSARVPLHQFPDLVR
jgi:hypothetical protein